ncbi:hypothetical protein ABT373_12500 [Streptomyces sp. NPDC000070]|uniref:hypothetical protein n=1 Tax=Streptomyces sp. NPDC000070 TaxID=3154240 RepID=UPI0033272A1A
MPKRYVLLPGFDDGLVLVPWQGMPPPVGTLELRGWWDSAPTVVPWIDGRPLWPRYPYERGNLDDQYERCDAGEV